MSSLSTRQKIANTLAKFQRTGTFGAAESAADSSTADDIGPPPPGSITVAVRCAGALGGDNW